ncbi:t-SNARE [Coprinopsis cinerea okayama7|uniref:t-SNARE n=1 Tax=Coprinopsis cinerea (strain Okayama-7 / 130 / ATCC MYA-4618 / FGSC 9003) TaxID=240176 RepID=A8N5W2_COPC7|nr:t-SNARE [Coprinopsis cinerea okayama7\|eukprot:XP_001830257.2 t-SNARE [Coprinopsis cinerea okayama7\
MSSSSSTSLEPTTRSRTSFFLSCRDSTTRTTRFSRRRSLYTDDPAEPANDDEHERLIGSSSHVALDVQLPPKWVDLADQVEEILLDAQSKIAALDKLHSKHILPGFSDRSQEEQEIEALTTDITKDFRRCHFLIQKIGSFQPHNFPPDPQSSKNVLLAAKNVQRGLAAKLQDMSATFRKKQRVYMEKLQGQATKNQDLLVASGAITLKGSEGMSAVDDDVRAAVGLLLCYCEYSVSSLRSFPLNVQQHSRCMKLGIFAPRHSLPFILLSGPIFFLSAFWSPKKTASFTPVLSSDVSKTHTRAQSMSLMHADPSAELRARDRELTEIAKSIATLAELFKDLSVLVIDQGTLLDSVEYNIEQTAVQLERAGEDLKVATE